MSIVGNLSPIELIFLSNTANTIEVSIQHPLFVLKNYLQFNKKVKYNFNNLYKGYLFNLYSLNTITCFQYLTYGYLYKKTNNDFTSSIISGTLSGFIAGPMEFLSINKKINESIFKCLKNNYKNLYIGLYPTLLREGIYTYGLLSLTSKIENTIKSRYNYIYSPILSGLFCTVLSHPFDTIKTYQQHHLSTTKYPHFKMLFNGLFFRSIRLINTFFIINECNKLYISKK